jgi:hypothetical protein
VLQRLLAWKGLVAAEPSKARPLHQHDIDILRRFFQHSFEQCALSAMSAQVAGIEEASSARFDL